MEAPQGAPTTGVQVETQASSPEAGTFSEEEFNRVNGRGGSPSPDEKEARPEGDQDPAEAKEPTEPGDKKEGEQPTKTAKRIEQLLKDRKEAQAALHKVKQEHATKEIRYEAALRKQAADIEALQQRLAQYENLEDPSFKLHDMESRQKARAEVEARERQLREQFQKEQEAAELKQLQAELFDAMDEAVSNYPHLTRAQLQAAFREHAQANPGVSYDEAPEVFRQLAQKLDEELLSRYEPRVLDKHKARLSAPQAISTSGTVRAPSVPSTREEMMADLERKFGRGYFG